MTDEERIKKAEEIARCQPQFFYWIYTMMEDAESEETKQYLKRLCSRAYHKQEGRDI